jgi:diguanylate cyclase (GGDEF)-like protein
MAEAAPKPRKSAPVRVLLVEDDTGGTRSLRELLEGLDDPPVALTHVTQVEEGLSLLREGGLDVVLLDLSPEEGEGLDALARVKVAAQAVPIIVLTREDDEILAVNALRFGAQDYLVRETCDLRLVARTVRHAVERHRILSDLSRSRQREHYMATHDGLTGLPNRSAFLDQLRRSMAYAARSQRRLAVLFLDLDRFKGINDSLGHPIGDDLLRIVAERLRGVVRESDMVARLGGDEFIVLLNEVRHEHDLARVARKVTSTLAQPCQLGQREYRVTASVGIAVFPHDGADPDVLIRNADTAMYHAKASGPNRFSYYAAHMNEESAQSLELETALRDAVERKAFHLVYQPQLDLDVGAVVGAEALLRWVDPRRGSISPAQFIPLAERIGVIEPLGEWVLEQACREAASWRRRELRIAVNVSTRQLQDETFAERVATILHATSLDPERLEIEITESSVLEEQGTMLNTLEALRHKGCRIVIDDFGTGYAALSALRRLPADGLKIDRSFVAEVNRSPADATIASGIISIARGLGMATVAEGVETREQAAFLHASGCPLMQGFYFAKPVRAEEFLPRIEEAEAVWAEEIPEKP